MNSEMLSYTIQNEEGEAILFSSLVGERPVVIFFVRHFG